MNPSKSFPIEQSYINLAIVNAKEIHEKEKELRHAQHATAVLGTFEEIYGMKTAIDVKNIFETCKNDEKQVLIFGRAGIGKSTFCRYIAYQWATGSYWPQYEMLALIPLRRLTTHRYPPDKSYSLLDLVKKEIFSFHLTGKEEELLKKHFDAKKILWILDGYDEIVQNVPPHLQCLFEQLLETPYHILTSRPYLNTLSYDVKMEITGFTDKNITEYVQRFFDQIKDELDDAMIKCQRLLNFLKSNHSIWGVAHIPVNLQLICSLWSNEDWSETEQLTITILYTRMTEWLCRRYLRTNDYQIRQLSTSEIDQHCQKELAFLENLAFNAMESNTIIIQSSILKKALNEAKVSSQEHPHILNMGILKSVNKQGIGNPIETDKDHYFVHLSFQEYFAARYLIKALKGSQTEKAIEFIKYQKYNQRYTLMFTFAAGLLSESDAKASLKVFWDHILGEPLDLVGIRHMQLVILCMEETTDKFTFSRHAELLECIAKCIQYSFTMKNKILRRHLSQSLQRAPSVACDQTIVDVLINLLQHTDTDIQREVLSFISNLKISNPPVSLITSVATRLHDRDSEVSRYACDALRGMGEKAATNEVITKLVSALGDQSYPVRGNACEVLGKMGEKAATNEVITKLVSALGDENVYVRMNACEALGKMDEKAATNEVITKLVSALGDQRNDVRWYACEVFGKMGEKAATNEVITKLVSALGDQSYPVRRNACQALGKMGEKAATNEVITKLVNALGDRSDYVRRNAREALGKMGEKAATNEVITKLVSALGDQSDYVRMNACEALGKMGEKAATNEVITKLVRALGDRSDYVRMNACEALGKMGEKAANNEVITKLVSALGDQRDDVRGNACRALGEMGEKAATNEVITKLVSALGDENDDVRMNACEALVKMGEKAATNEVITKLVSALGNQRYDVRRNACEALGKMGEKAATNEVIAKLVSTLGDKRDYVRMTACEVLVKMGEKAATNEVITKLVVSALGDESDGFRWYVCEVLEKMGEKAATNEVITKLVSALGDQRDYVRRNACEVLKKMGEKAATNEVITKLVSALGDENDYVRMKACRALGNMGEKAATNEVITKLVSALGDQSDYVRRNACEALGKMGEKAVTNEVITKLVSALGDQSDDVRMNACEALVKMGEKAATNEVITKLVIMMNNNNNGCLNSYAAKAVGNILGSSAVIKQLTPKIVADLCVCKYASDCLKHVSEDKLIDICQTTENRDWLSGVTQLTFLRGTAVTANENRVVVYGKTEPAEVHIPNSGLRHQLFEAFINERKRLHLFR
jgi:HEAT repeat protein